MADNNMIFGITIKGNAAGAIAAIGAAGTALQGLDAKIKGMAGRAVGGGAVPPVSSADKALQRSRDQGLRQLDAGVTQAYSNMTRAMNQAFNSFRLFTQGISEISRVLTQFVALPLIAFFGLGARAAIDFEAAMVKVVKTTNFAGAELQDVTGWIREFAKYTTSSQTELAGFAEEFGRMGVREPTAMKRLIRMTEMLTAATDLTADTVTHAVGRIATAFGYDLDSEGGVRAVEQLSNAINKLENTTGASAAEIVDGLLNVAASGGLLRIPVDDMAALTATMISMGVNADAVGNRITRFYQNLIEKSDEVAKMMTGWKSKVTGRFYETGDAIKKMVQEDPAGLLRDVVEAVSDVSDPQRADALVQFFDIFGNVGAKVGVLSGNVKKLSTALQDAHDEFLTGNSLFEEYDKQLMTTQSHIKILRNNLNDAAITMGDAFLPVINRIIEYAIPGIQILASAFKNLSYETKLLIVGIPLITAVLLPVLFVIMQVAHGASMLFMGFGNLLTVSMSMAKSVMGIGKIFFSLFRVLGIVRTGAGALSLVFGGLGSTVLALIVTLGGLAGVSYLVLRSLNNMGVDVVGFFKNLATRATAWGENLMVTYGNGLISGAVNFVAKVLTKIAEMVASFFEAHSPPEQGPLSDIDKWGGPLFSTYLRGFYNADFGILSDLGGMIKNILSNIFTGDEAEATINKLVASARKGIAKLIDIFNRTGEISQSVLDSFTKNLGPLGGEVQKLVKLWLDYEKTQRRIKDLEAERQKADTQYGAEVEAISRMNLSAEEKAARIRASLQKRNSRVDQIDKEKKAEEDKANVLKDQLDWQKQFIQAQIDQADIMTKVAKALEKMGGAMDKLGGLSFGNGNKKKDEEEALKSIDDFKTTIQKRIEGAREVIRNFIRGFQGDENPFKGMKADVLADLLGIDPEVVAELQKAYDLGKKIFDLFHPKKKEGGDQQGNDFGVPALTAITATIQGIAAAVSKAWEDISTAMENQPIIEQAINTILDMFSPKTKEELEGTSKSWGAFGLILGTVIGVMLKLGAAALLIIAWIALIPQNLSTFSSTVAATVLELNKGFDQWVKDWQVFFQDLGKRISEEWVPGLLKEFIKGFTSFVSFTEPLREIAQRIADFFEPHSPPKEGPLSTIDTWGGKLLGLLIDGFLGGDVGPLATVGEAIKKAVGGAFDTIFGVKEEDKKSGGFLAGVVGIFKGGLDEITTLFTTTIPTLKANWDELRKQPETALGDLDTWLTTKFGTVLTALTTWFTTNTPLMEQKWNLFRDTFKTSFQALPGMVGVVFTSLFYNPVVVEALKVAYEKFEEAGRYFAGSVAAGIDSLAGEVVGAMTSIVDGIIVQIERGMVAIAALVDAANKAKNIAVTPSGGSGTKSVSTGNQGNGNGTVKWMAAGGIATGPTLAMIAEGASSEAVIPLDRLPSLVSSMMPTPEAASVVIQINNPVVRDDTDVSKIVRQAKREFEEALNNQRRMRGRS